MFSDLDETLAPPFRDVSALLARELEALLAHGIALVVISGEGREGVHRRVVQHVMPGLRRHILVGSCMGAELWGYESDGMPRTSPFYSVYEEMPESMRVAWRRVVANVLSEAGLLVFPEMPLEDFHSRAGDDPKAVILADRGPQITLVFANENHDEVTHSWRDVIMTNLTAALEREGLPIVAIRGSSFALDLRIRGVAKRVAIEAVLSRDDVLESVRLKRTELFPMAERVEVWGDRFVGDGVDFEMVEALPPDVRAIDFRLEDEAALPADYGLVIWRGTAALEEGVLEYLRTRRAIS